MDIRQVHKEIEAWHRTVEPGLGHMDPDYMECLYEYARNAKGPILEIGVHMGRSAAMLAYGAQESGQKVVLVDCWTHTEWTIGPILEEHPAINRALPICLNMLKERGLRDWVIPVVASTEQVLMLIRQMKWGLVHIDGDHRKDAVLFDVRAVERNVLIGGHIVFHDSGTGIDVQKRGQWEPNVAIDEWLQGKPKGWLELTDGQKPAPCGERIFQRQ